MIYTDQINHQFELVSTPKRIISLVPSQTELLYDLGLEQEVVGITKFCIHPNNWFKSKNRVGGTKTVDFEKIAALQPDLIIANKEENTQLEIEELQKRYPVYVSDISNLEESLQMIQQIGEITAKENESKKIVNKIQTEFELLSNIKFKKRTALYFIWKSPYMSINQNTFINDMMQRCGFQNLIDGDTEYPIVTEEQILELNPDFIFLSSEPYPFKEKHLKDLQNICSDTEIILVDGEYFSWYGSRLQNAPNYFKGLINKIS
ncbi:MAG: ABC transporter substrate-binding protein [Flavobacteriales bacterium]|nr:ABC transporter substrate-binding protein [Flavobacteriales bacterium]